MFAEVDSDDLVVGVKYAILLRGDSCMYRTGILETSKRGGTFRYTIPHTDIKDIDTYNTLRNMQGVHKNLCYYAFVQQKEKIQQAMEQRALDKILKRLVNDDFIWHKIDK